LKVYPIFFSPFIGSENVDVTGTIVFTKIS
jgi:hypothetical protein